MPKGIVLPLYMLIYSSGKCPMVNHCISVVHEQIKHGITVVNVQKHCITIELLRHMSEKHGTVVIFMKTNSCNHSSTIVFVVKPRNMATRVYL